MSVSIMHGGKSQNIHCLVSLRYKDDKWPREGTEYSSTSHQAPTRLKTNWFHLQNYTVVGISHFCIEFLQQSLQASVWQRLWLQLTLGTEVRMGISSHPLCGVFCRKIWASSQSK